MQFTKRVIYAFEALGEFAKAGQLSNDDIARRLDIAFPYALKITGALTKGGLLKSKQGAQGGYTLAKPLDKVTQAEVIRVVDKGFFDDDPADDEPMAAIRRKLRKQAGWTGPVTSVL
jgi:Rrf2 family iron-sulfur cluster assembly transcriptional regulator